MVPIDRRSTQMVLTSSKSAAELENELRELLFANGDDFPPAYYLLMNVRLAHQRAEPQTRADLPSGISQHSIPPQETGNTLMKKGLELAGVTGGFFGPPP